MAIWTLLTLLIPAFGHLDLGSLNGYYTLEEVGETIMNLTNWYPELASKLLGSYFQELSLTNTSANSDYKKSLVLITGGLYSGNPMTSLVVLYLANKLAFQYESGNSTIISLLNNNQLLFLPVLNTAAYSYMEKHVNESIFPIKTGLEGNSNCVGVDVGINPDRNFPYGWMNSTLSCQNDYPGSSPLQSNISKYLSSYFNSIQSPSLLFSFNEEGDMIYTPYTSAPDYLSESDFYFYNYVVSTFLPGGYWIGSKQEVTGSYQHGTLIDYAYNLSTLSFQIQLNSTFIKTKILDYADLYYDFVVNTILQTNLDVSVVYNGINEDVCDFKNSICEYYSLVSFKFVIKNFNAKDFDYNFTFVPNFDINSNYHIDHLELLQFFNYTNDVNQTIFYFNSSDNKDYNIVLLVSNTSKYSYTTVSFVYKRLVNTDKEDYKGSAYIYSNVGSYYTAPIFISLDDDLYTSSNKKSDDDGDDKHKAMITGLILLLVLLLLLCLAGLWLFCRRRRRHKEPQNNFSPDPNFAAGENPRI